ncbi:MAG: nuclear transport factor 2 family protein [Pseudomonadota bacterium]|nr:nuclear transport factor 2 family protein [Pseudomonadota bacterium]
MSRHLLHLLAAAACLATAGGSVHAAAPATPDLAPRLARIADRIASIDAQATRIEDYNEIRNLQRIYGFYFDEALWDQVVDLFSNDATVEVGPHGVYAGKASIRRYYMGLTGGRVGLQHGELNNQSQLSPVITLAADGQSAKARWRVLVQDGVFKQGSNWGGGVYENEYVKQDGVWKIRRLHFFTRFYSPYKDGWTRTTEALNARYGRSTAKPDRPSSLRYATWPERFVAPMHFAGEGVGVYRLAPANTARAAAPANGQQRTVAQLEAEVRALELKVARLRAVDDIENLQGTYGYYVDMSMADPTAALFADDATLEILQRGVYIGRDRIYEYMRRLGLPSQGRMFTHMLQQPVIHVSSDGSRAWLRGRQFEIFGVHNVQAQWAENTYEHSYTRQDGVWKIQTFNAWHSFYAPYEGGWIEQSNPMNYYPEYPPDLPHSVKYEPYPSIFVAPFHYRNPVSGR